MSQTTNITTTDPTTALRDDLRELLMRWDLLGIYEQPECADEYDCMIEPLIDRLSRGNSAELIQAWIAFEVEDHFGCAVSPNQVDEARLARDLVAWWASRPTSRV